MDLVGDSTRHSGRPSFVVSQDSEEPDSEALNGETLADIDEVPEVESVGSWADDESDSDADEENDRSESRHTGFLLTLLSPLLDVVAVWRFPYIAYKHGGIIFVPFLLVYLLVGIPVSHLELTLGQLFGGHIGGNCALGSIVPWLRGVCFSSTALLALMCIYHMTVVSWALFYFFTSMQDTLPWAQCPTNLTKNCFIYANEWPPCRNLSCHISHEMNATFMNPPRPSSEHYFQEIMLSASSSWFQFGPLLWKLSLCLLCAWFFVLLDVRKGKISFRKTYILPSVAIFVFLCGILGKSSSGLHAGFKLYFNYDWYKLKDFRMWIDASTQVVLSSGIGTGLLQVMGRRSHLLSSLRRDACLCALANIAAAFFSGMVAFAALGFLAAKLHIHDLNFLKDQLGVTFIVFSAVLGEFPASVVMSILFFLLWVIVSLKRQRVLVYALATAALEGMRSSKAKRHRSLFITIVCIFLLGLGIIFTFNIGVRLLLIMDLFVFGWPALVISLVECLAVMLLYDKRKFLNEIDQLLQVRLGRLWTWSWNFITPTVILVIIIFGIAFDGQVEYDGLDFTWEARLIGWALVTVILCFGPFYALYRLAYTRRQNMLVAKSETESVLPGRSNLPVSEEPVKPQWHALAMRRKGSITPAPKILVVKMDEPQTRYPASIIPYGFVLTPKKDSKTPRNSTSKMLGPQLGDLLSQSSAASCVSSITMPSPHTGRKTNGGSATLRLPSVAPKGRRPLTAPVGEMVFAYRDSPTTRQKAQGPQTSHLAEPPMRPRAASDGGGDRRKKEVVIEVGPILTKERCPSSNDLPRTS